MTSKRPLAAATRAFLFGWTTVVRHPALVVAIYLLTLAAALPFALSLGVQLRRDLDRSHPEGEMPYDIDAEWWVEYRQHASGLAATFTPEIIGFAAPLSNLSALLDATPRPWVLAAPLALYALIASWWWGGALQRLAIGRPLGARAFARAGVRYLLPVLLVNLVAVAIAALLYVALHPLLFGPLFDAFASIAATERDAFLWRTVLYLFFGGTLAAVSVTADFARIFVVAGASAAVPASYRRALSFVRVNWRAVLLLFVLGLLCVAAMFAAYGVVETYGGARVGGWRAVVLGQMYIVGRLTVRVAITAAQVRLADSFPESADYVSAERANPGPPAAT